MPPSGDSPAVAALLCGRPTVGALMALCEENFERLSRLIPDLPARSGVYTSRTPEAVALYLDVEEQARFTTTIRLTHLFPVQGETRTCADPDARLKVYHDARQVEVIDLRQSIWRLRAAYQSPALAAKWQLNLFLGKWLAYCLQQGHSFNCAGAAQRVPATDARVSTCL